METTKVQQKTILIIKSKSNNLTAEEGFLRNRDWKIFSTVSLKEALAHMVQHKPAFVLISVDHPDKKLKTLPKVLKQAFSTCVISFAELNEPASFKMLSDSTTEYLIYPPLTGPAIERAANKYYKDQAAKLLQIGDAEKWQTTSSASPIVEEGNGPGTPLKTGDLFPSQTPAASHLDFSSDPTISEADRDYSGDGRWRKKSPSKGFWQAQDIAAISSFAPASTAFLRNQEQEQSIMFQGTKDALEKSVAPHSAGVPVQKVEDSTNVACIVIESARFSGYLVTALGKDRKMDQNFMKGVHERLFKFLEANGEKVNREEAMNIKIQQVPFEDWAMDCAEFLRKSVHRGDEVAMAFFPYAQPKIELKESHSSEMSAVHMNDLESDKEVDFNLYIFLPTNQKYVLYTPRGGKFYGDQKVRLAKQGIMHLHLLKTETGSLQKYRAQNYLNGKIAEFETNRRSPEPAR